MSPLKKHSVVSKQTADVNSPSWGFQVSWWRSLKSTFPKSIVGNGRIGPGSEGNICYRERKKKTTNGGPRTKMDVREFSHESVGRSRLCGSRHCVFIRRLRAVSFPLAWETLPVSLNGICEWEKLRGMMGWDVCDGNHLLRDDKQGTCHYETVLMPTYDFLIFFI